MRWLHVPLRKYVVWIPTDKRARERCILWTVIWGKYIHGVPPNEIPDVISARRLYDEKFEWGKGLRFFLNDGCGRRAEL